MESVVPHWNVITFVKSRMEGSKKCPDCCGREEVNSLFSESGSARVSSWCWQVAGVSVDQSEARRVFSLTNQKPGFCQSLDEFEGSHDMNPSLGSGYQAVMYRLILSELKLDIVTLSSNWPLMQLRTRSKWWEVPMEHLLLAWTLRTEQLWKISRSKEGISRIWWISFRVNLRVCKGWPLHKCEE